MISYRFWQESLSGDPAVIGKTIAVNGAPFVVIGVMPAKFYGVDLNRDGTDMWVPLTMQQEVMLHPSLLGPRGEYWLHMMGRRNNGASLSRIQSWITSQLQLYMEHREGPLLSRTRKSEIQKIYVDMRAGDRGISNLRLEYARSIYILMTVVLLVLLIACANLANFLLARASSREREISTRLALGSTRLRIVRQVLTETVLLSVCGGALGLLLAYGGTRALIDFVVAGANHSALTAVPDGRVLVFTISLSLFTGFVFGLAPALRLARLSVSPGAEANVRTSAGSAGRSSRLLPKLLVMFQVTVSLMLLAGAGLFLRTLQNLQNQDFGFARHNLLVVRCDPKLAGYKPEQLNALYQEILDRIEALPGIRSATISGSPPMSGWTWNSPIVITGRTPHANEDLSTLLNRVGPRYFETLNVPVLRGRPIDSRDLPNAMKSVVVNQTFANHFFPRGDAVGHSFTIGDPAVPGTWQIVGVVRDAKYTNAREKPQRMAYLAVMQLAGDDQYAYYVQLRTSGDPAAVAGNVRRALTDIDPNLPILDVKTVREELDRGMANETLISRLSGFFSVLALLLACIGLYGVMTYNVVRRSNEIGIRMTLGAETHAVQWMVLRESLLLLGAGIAVGLPATLAVMRLVRSQLFGLSASDPLTFTTAILLISLVTLASAYFPARRAARVDPVVALRYQ